MSTTGYTSLSVTKESGAPAIDIPAGVWTEVFADTECSLGPNIIHGQLYYEGCVEGTTISTRVRRKAGDYTCMDDRTVSRSTWASSYFDLDFVNAGNTTRALEVWSEKPCRLRTHNLKVLNVGAYIAARITVEGD